MEATSKKTVEVTIVMSDYEARWLMAYLQNYVGGEDETEGKKSRAMREILFNALRNEIGD